MPGARHGRTESAASLGSEHKWRGNRNVINAVRHHHHLISSSKLARISRGLSHARNKPSKQRAAANHLAAKAGIIMSHEMRYPLLEALLSVERLS